jgi:hypothetical protein
MHPIDELFTAGLRVWGGDGVRVLRDGGMLAVASGRLAICDPFQLLYPDELSAIRIRPGSYRVRLALVRLFGAYEMAASRIDLSSKPVRAWKRTARVVGVDSASACFADTGAANSLVKAGDPLKTAERLFGDLHAARFSHRSIRLGARAPNVIGLHVCDDGGYSIWEGRGAQDELVSLCVPWSRTGLADNQRRRLLQRRRRSSA